MSFLTWMRHRDLAIVALLLLVAICSLALFVRSWVQAGNRARTARAQTPRSAPLSRTRAMAGPEEQEDPPRVPDA